MGSRLLWLGSIVLAAIDCSPTPPQSRPDAQQPPPLDGSTILDAGPPPITVTVYLNAQPEPGVLVAFQDASGAALGTATTDAKGTASKVLPAGSQVTVLLGSPTAPVALYTYVGVEPGDALAVIDPATYNGSIAVTLDAIPPKPPNGAFAFTGAVGDCSTGFGQPPAVISATPECYGADRFPVLVLAESSVGPPLGYTFSKDNLVDVDAGTASVALAGSWLTQTGTWNITASNPPANALSTSVAFDEVANKVARSAWQTPPGAFVTHPGYPDFVQSEADAWFSVPNASDVAIGGIATRAPAPALGGSASFDLTQLLPTITSTASDFVTAPPRPSVSWKATGSLTSADGSFVHVDWVQFAGGLQQSLSWDFVVPPGVTCVQAPSLPPEAAAWTPAGTIFASTSPTVVTVDGLSGYARLRNVAVRPRPHVTATAPPFVPPLPQDGTVHLTMYGPNLG